MEDFHSTHCDKCINFAHCKKIKALRKSRPDEESIPCPIICCKLCDHKFHECKSSEHELLCLVMRVPCINVEFGCPLLMERGKRGLHLANCPASVIVCTMEWNRWPLPPGKMQPFDMNPTQLDVVATLRDQRTLTSWKECVPSTLRYLLKNHMNDRHPVMPLGVSGLRIPRSVINQTIIEQNLKMENGENASSSEEESEHDESSDSPWGWKKCPPGLQESVCTKLKALNVTQETNGHNNGLKNSVECNGEEEKDARVPDKSNGCENGAVSKKKNVELSLMIEVRTRCQRKPPNMYTFMCCREFRRDEFAGHFSQIHSGIHTQLNGWLFTRCPMSNLGCGFGLHRMQPIDENYNVIYNPTADGFCFTQKLQSSLNNGCSAPEDARFKTDETTVSFSSLPFELLVQLTKYLDPLSLNSLSLTNRSLRDACSFVVVERGIVVFQWEKKKVGVGWEIAEKKWIFSSAFSPIRKWKFVDAGRMITHMKTCPFFERNIPSKPFAYPVTIDQL